jgi:hypothetical protein
MCPAIHTSSRSWLRSSSTHEPSDPPPRIVLVFRFRNGARYVYISRDERTCGKTTKRRGSGREHSLPSKPRRDRPLNGRPPPGQAVEHLPLLEGGSTDAGTGRSAGTPPLGTWDVSLEADNGGPTRLSEAGDGQRHSFAVMILPQVHLRKPCYDFYFL